MALSLARSASASAFKPAVQQRPAGRRPLRVRMEAAPGRINTEIKQDVDKVVDTFTATDLAKKAVFCRCWRSATFPMCNGAHMKHNAATGDNVGPLIISKGE